MLSTGARLTKTRWRSASPTAPASAGSTSDGRRPTWASGGRPLTVARSRLIATYLDDAAPDERIGRGRVQLDGAGFGGDPAGESLANPKREAVGDLFLQADRSADAQHVAVPEENCHRIDRGGRLHQHAQETLE